mgnify:CR=1 FL=1
MRGCIDGQRSIDELRIVPLVSLDDARGDFLYVANLLTFEVAKYKKGAMQCLFVF